MRATILSRLSTKSRAFGRPRRSVARCSRAQPLHRLSMAICLNIVVGLMQASASTARDIYDRVQVQKANERIAAQEADPAVCGWLGVMVTPMTRDVAESLGMTESYGAVSMAPEPGSPAANAGIEEWDVITAIDGTPIARSSDFAKMISTRAPGSTVHLITYRNLQLIDRAVTLGSSKCR